MKLNCGTRQALLSGFVLAGMAIGTMGASPVGSPAEAEKPSAVPEAPPNALFQVTAEQARDLEDIRSESATYAATFEPGVVVDTSVPAFARKILAYPGGDRTYANVMTRYLAGDVTPGSVDLQNRLLAFFESQPEITRVRVTIGCRSTLCLLQFIELADASEAPIAASSKSLGETLFYRLTSERWYRNFIAEHLTRTGPRDASVWYRFTRLELRTR